MTVGAVGGHRRTAPTTQPARVLFLHGLGCATSVWDPALAEMGPRIDPWVIRLPWHHLAEADWSHRCDPAALLADAVTSAGRFDAIVAHSFAAVVLLEAVATGRVDPAPAVLVSPFHRADPAQFDWAALSYYQTGFHRIFAEALRLNRTDADPERVDAAARTLRDRIGPYGWFRFFDAYLRTPFVDLATVTAPQLVLLGDADIVTRPADAATMAGALPRGRLRLMAGCGHFPMVERPARFAAEVETFVDSLYPTRQRRLEPT